MGRCTSISILYFDVNLAAERAFDSACVLVHGCYRSCCQTLHVLRRCVVDHRQPPPQHSSKASIYFGSWDFQDQLLSATGFQACCECCACASNTVHRVVWCIAMLRVYSVLCISCYREACRQRNVPTADSPGMKIILVNATLQLEGTAALDTSNDSLSPPPPSLKNCR